MGKWTQYGKCYNSAWEKEEPFKDWICSVPRDSTKANCRYCKTEIRAHRTDISAHASTEKHRRNALPFSNARTLLDVGCKRKSLDNTVKVAELKLAAHTACQSSILTIDHLGEIVKEVSAKDLSLHRTKCTAVITKVLSPALHDDLLTDLHDCSYSLIVDESTDVGLEKQLCIMVRYYSKAQPTIVTTFLGLVSIAAGSAETVFATITALLRNKQLPVEQCLGLATDGCNTMCGANNSVITKFREVCPNIVHIKCICHSLQLCSSYALKVMPRNVEFMVAETHKWFAHSTLRQQKYSDLYRCINVGKEPLKLLKTSDTHTHAGCQLRHAFSVCSSNLMSSNSTFSWLKMRNATTLLRCCFKCIALQKTSCSLCSCIQSNPSGGEQGQQAVQIGQSQPSETDRRTYDPLLQHSVACNETRNIHFMDINSGL